MAPAGLITSPRRLRDSHHRAGLPETAATDDHFPCLWGNGRRLCPRVALCPLQHLARIFCGTCALYVRMEHIPRPFLTRAHGMGASPFGRARYRDIPLSLERRPRHDRRSQPISLTYPKIRDLFRGCFCGFDRARCWHGDDRGILKGKI